MKKLILLLFVICGIFTFGEKRVKVNLKSYCTGFISAGNYDTGGEHEYYMFEKCIINGKTYYGNDLQDVDVDGTEPTRAALRIYFNNYSQLNEITSLIEYYGRVFIKNGVTIVDEGEGTFALNVNKIEIK